VLRGHNERISAIAFSPDGKKLVVGSLGHNARGWNIGGSGVPLELTGRESAISAVAFTPDGRRLATGTSDNLVRLWNVEGNEAPVVLSGHRDWVSSVAFSPGGQAIASGSLDKTVRIWVISGDAQLEALWNATSDCMPAVRRQEPLAESRRDARQRYAACRQEVARRRGWPEP